LVFFTIVAFLHWYVIPFLVPEKRRLLFLHVFLLLASYTFYMSWEWQFGFLLAFTTVMDYTAARVLDWLDEGENPEKEKYRRYIIAASVVMNLGVLAYFKYTDFFISSFIDLINTLHPGSFNREQRDSLLLNLILPLGISFFTFHSMNYTIDVFRRVQKAERSLLRFAIYVAFFPVLLAGPIITAREFLPQLRILPALDLDRVKKSARWFLLGYFKKAVLADNMAPIVDTIYRNVDQYGAAGHWLGAFGFWVQVYCDFSGYSDMAWGSAMFLGYSLPENFRMPYLSRSVTEHWQRWHISLIKWIRDYLYIPLGGNRVSYFRHKVNVFLTMFLAGIWHGANWTFAIWGGIHGIILAIESAVSAFFEKRFPVERRPSFLRLFVYPGNALRFVYTTFVTVFFGTIFRSANIHESVLILKRMAFLDQTPGLDISPSMYRPVMYGVLAVYIGHILGYFLFEKKVLSFKVPIWVETSLYPLSVLLLIQFGAADTAPFIYFVF